jgi:hypothetical protein
MTRKGVTAMTDTNSRTAHLLALMKKGDDAFNARDFPRRMRSTTRTWSRISPGSPNRSTDGRRTPLCCDG